MGSQPVPQDALKIGGPPAQPCQLLKGSFRHLKGPGIQTALPTQEVFPVWKCLAMTLCGCTQPAECQDSPLAYNLADVAGLFQQLGQEELRVRDATYNLLRRVGWKSTT